MKTKYRLIVSVMLCLAMTGCSTNAPQGSEESRTPIEDLQAATTELADAETDAESTTELLPGTVKQFDSESAKIINGPDYSYDGEPVKITGRYSMVGDIPTFGLIVLCDGIAVPFTTEFNEEPSQVQIIPYANNGEDQDVDLYITPIGKKGDLVSIQIVDILDPEFDIDAIDFDSENAYQPMINGGKFRIGSLAGLNILLNQDGLERTTSISTNAPMEDIPEDVIEDNKILREDGTIENKLLSLQFYRENVSFRVAVEHGEKLPIEAKVSGTSGQDVFVSFYLDNQLTPIWNGCDYLQCHVDDTHYTQITGELDTSQLEPGRYLCYTACGNTKDIMSVAPVTAFILEVL